MRLAAISDMHGNAVAFEAVIADLRRQSPDAIVCLGDVVMRGPQPGECVDMLRSLNPLVTVRGNFDHRMTRPPAPDWRPTSYKEELYIADYQYTCARLPEAEQEWLGHLPVAYAGSHGGVQLELHHAGPGSLGRYTWPWAPNEELLTLRADEATQLVLFGHMHHPFVRSMPGCTVVNAGSVGLSFDGDNRAAYVLIDLVGSDMAVQVRRVSYDTEAAIAAARQAGMPNVDVFAYAVRQAAYPYSASVTGQ